jgi:hypothetical protein
MRSMYGLRMGFPRLLPQLTAGAFLICICAPTRSAVAQDRRWDVEGYGGVVAARTAGDGTRTLPAAGAPIVTSNPIFPSRQVPSWLFGDGATLLNGVNAEFGKAGRIAPLDGAFGPLASTRVASVGIRVRRRLSDRLSAEIGVDAFTRPEDTSSGLDAAIEASRGSFRTALTDLLASGPFSAVTVDAIGTTGTETRRRETAATLALNARFAAWGAFVPYLTVGGGVLTGSGSLPSASIQGRYRFSIAGEVPIDETDLVSLRYSRPASFVAVLGAGLRRDLSDRWGVRVDGRMLLGPDSTRLLIDATPSSARSGPSGFVESFTNPAIQFSNDPSTGRRSTLSGPALQEFDVFSGGLQTRTLVTVGVFRRF